jgi:predicted  nucleic acid-binding Zn-ribbon protein
MPKDIETEVAVLKEQTKTLHNDLSEMKGDIKQIKEILLKTFVTKEEFTAFKKELDGYRKSQNMQKWIVGLITAIITAILVTEINNFFR